MENDNSQIFIRFNKKLYQLAYLKEAVSAFDSLCKAEIKDEKNYFIVVITSLNNLEAEKIAHELSNYVLGLMKNSAAV